MKNYHVQVKAFSIDYGKPKSKARPKNQELVVTKTKIYKRLYENFQQIFKISSI